MAQFFSDGKVALVIEAQRLENIDQDNIARISVHQYQHYCKKEGVLKVTPLCSLCVFHDQSTRTKSCPAICFISTYIALLSCEMCVNPFQGDLISKTKLLSAYVYNILDLFSNMKSWYVDLVRLFLSCRSL